MTIRLPFRLKTLVPEFTSLKIDKLHPDDQEMFPGIEKNNLENGWYLGEINIPEDYRGTGIGTQLVEEIITEAQKANVHIFLQAYPIESKHEDDEPNFEIEKQRLIAFYSRLGFTHTACGWMFLPPKS